MRWMMAGMLLLIPLPPPLAAARAGQPPPAAPADCPASANPTPPGGADSSAPVTVFPALPGGGFAAVDLGAAALNGATCTPASPPLPKNVLEGDPDGDLLNNQGSAVLDGDAPDPSGASSSDN